MSIKWAEDTGQFSQDVECSSYTVDTATATHSGHVSVIIKSVYQRMKDWFESISMIAQIDTSPRKIKTELKKDSCYE